MISASVMKGLMLTISVSPDRSLSWHKMSVRQDKFFLDFHKKVISSCLKDFELKINRNGEVLYNLSVTSDMCKATYGGTYIAN